MSLVDTVVSIALTGVLSAALATTIQVIVRTVPTVQRDLGEAHGVEQVLRYLPADVSMTPAETTSFSTDPAAAPGCSGAVTGTNVLLLRGLGALPGDLGEVSYRYIEDPAGDRMVRTSCELTPTMTLGAVQTIDMIDNVPVPAVHIEAAAGRVSYVELGLETASGRQRAVSGVPRSSDSRLVAVPPPPPPCTDNPLRYTYGYEAFVADDLHLGGIDSYGPVAAGDDLTFSGNYLVTPRSAVNGFIAPTESVVTGILVGDEIDWDNSSGALALNSTVLHLGEAGDTVKGASNVNQTKLYEAGSIGVPPEFTNNSFDQPVVGANAIVRPALVDVAAAFVQLESASDSLAALPGSCASAANLATFGVNGIGAWSGSGPVWIEYQADHVNVLNTTVAQLLEMNNVNRTPASAPGSATTLLVINVSDAGSLRFTPPIWTQNEPRSVIWNFPAATSVELDGPLWGTVLAPRAQVIGNGDMRGNVIANSFTTTAGSLDWDRRFAGVLPWDPWVPT